MRAKVLVAVLAVLALAGAVGTIVGWSSDGDPATSDVPAETVTELQATIDELTAERDQLTVARDEAVGRVGELETSLTAAEVELDDASARIAQLDAANDSLAAERATLEGQLAEVEGQIATLESELDAVILARDALVAEVAEANATIDQLESDLVAQVALTNSAVNERDALAALFPLTLDTTLQNADLAGDYDADVSALYCEGFTNCGTLPPFDELTIVESGNGWLRVEIDGYLDAGLFLTEGSLFAVAGSTTAVPACDGAPRVATVSLTLFAGGLTVTDDGSSAIEDLGASLMVQAPSTGSCAGGLAFYGVELTPAG